MVYNLITVNGINVRVNGINAMFKWDLINSIVGMAHSNKVALTGSTCHSIMGESFQNYNPEFRILRFTFHRKSASKC